MNVPILHRAIPCHRRRPFPPRRPSLAIFVRQYPRPAPCPPWILRSSLRTTTSVCPRSCPASKTHSERPLPFTSTYVPISLSRMNFYFPIYIYISAYLYHVCCMYSSHVILFPVRNYSAADDYFCLSSLQLKSPWRCASPSDVLPFPPL